MKRILVPVATLSILFFISCHECKTTVGCTSGTLYFQPIGYTAADIDSAWLVRYQTNGRFDSTIDSFRQDPYYLQFKNDTCNLSLQGYVGYDCKLKFPTTGQAVAVANMKVIGSTTKEIKYPCGKGGPGICDNTMLSCTLNGVDTKFTDPNNWPTYWIHK